MAVGSVGQGDGGAMSDVMILGGVGLVFGGLWWIYPPAAVVVLGVILLAGGVVRGWHE